MAEHDAIYDKPAAYEEGDKIIYRASSLGSCTGALVRARLGVTGSPPTDLMAERFQEGHDWEAEVIAAGLGVDWVQQTTPSWLERFGKVVQDQAGVQIETELCWGNKIIRCHPDGIAVHGGKVEGARVVEAKFFGADLYNTTIRDVEKRGMRGLGATRAWQASIEMLSTGLPLLYILAQKQVEEKEVDGEKVRVVTGLAGPPVVYEWDTPCYSLVDVKMRVAEVEGWVTRGEMPPCPVPFDYPCAYWAEHEKAEKEDVDDEVLGHLVESYGRAVEAVDRHKAEADRIKGDIADRLIEIHVDSGRIGGWEFAHVSSRPGNVSWKKAYDALAKETGQKVEVDGFRGAEVAGGVRMTKVKGE